MEPDDFIQLDKFFTFLPANAVPLWSLPKPQDAKMGCSIYQSKDEKQVAIVLFHLDEGACFSEEIRKFPYYTTAGTWCKEHNYKDIRITIRYAARPMPRAPISPACSKNA